MTTTTQIKEIKNSNGNYRTENFGTDLEKFRDWFNIYKNEGFKPILLYGYSASNKKRTEVERYKKAKTPISEGWTDKDYTLPTLYECMEHIEAGGWIGWLLPSTIDCIDVEEQQHIEAIKTGCINANIKPGINVTDNGEHFLFKANEKVTGDTNCLVKGGFRVTYRKAGKNYLILPPINNRHWDSWIEVDKLPEFPDILLKANKNDISAICYELSWLINNKIEQLSKYETIDQAFMAMLVQCGVKEEIIYNSFGIIYSSEYDHVTTENMYSRAKTKIENGEPVISTGSFIDKMKELDFKEVLDCTNKLLKLSGKNNEKEKQIDSPYFEGRTFIPLYLAEEIMKNNVFFNHNGNLYRYKDGVYKAEGEEFIKEKCRILLKKEARNNRINEVTSHILDMTVKKSEKLNNHKNLINLKNGMFNYINGELLPHSSDYLSTMQIPVTYNPQAECESIDYFFETTLPKDCIELVKELFGYCLIPDTSHEKAFMLTGTGANGKSTFLHLLEAFIGSDNVSKVPLQELDNNRFKRAELFGKLVNLFADLDSQEAESSTYFKTVVSGDSIDAEEKHKKPFFFKPFSRLIFSANEIPTSRDNTYAYFRRWIIIPFPHSFKGNKILKDLKSLLTDENELSGLLNHAFTGLARLRKQDDFSISKSVRESLKEYEKQNNPVTAFIDEKCILHPDAFVERTLLHTSYMKFCKDNHFKDLSNIMFYKKIRILDGVTEKRDGSGSVRGKTWNFTGISLKKEK